MALVHPPPWATLPAGLHFPPHSTLRPDVVVFTSNEKVSLYYILDLVQSAPFAGCESGGDRLGHEILTSGAGRALPRWPTCGSIFPPESLV